MTARRSVADRAGLEDIRARLITLDECLEDGDLDTARAIVHALLNEIGVERGQARCRWCRLQDWPGRVEQHERTVHPHQLLDLEESERRAA